MPTLQNKLRGLENKLKELKKKVDTLEWLNDGGRLEVRRVLEKVFGTTTRSGQIEMDDLSKKEPATSYSTTLSTLKTSRLSPTRSPLPGCRDYHTIRT